MSQAATTTTTTTIATATPPALTAEPNDAANYVFDDSQVRTYNLIVSASDLASIDQSPTAEMYVPASLELEGHTYGPYRMRYKGKAGSFEPPCTLAGPGAPTPKIGKCSIKVDFAIDGNHASFFGLKKLNFHSMNQDESMLRERLGYALFRAMGIAAPRAAHARLLINGTLEGLFTMVEQVDATFARARFGEGGAGNLYKEVWPTYSDAGTYAAALETNTSHPDVQRMLDFNTAVDTSADAFARYIDRDYMLRYIAVDRVIENDDGIFHFFCGALAQGNNPGPFGNHNYYWYEARDSPRFWLVPWDLDYVFEARVDDQVYPEWTVDAPCVCGYPIYGLQRPAACDKIVTYLRDWLKDYNLKVDELIAGPFAPDTVNAKLDAWSSQIQATVTEASGRNGAPTFATWVAAVAQLRAKIASARQHRGRVY
jgi:spore coat protein CotH